MNPSPARQLQNAVADLLKADPWMVEHGVTVALQDQLDLMYVLQDALKALGLTAEVAVTRAEPVGPCDLQCDFSVVVTELPLINRDRANAATALDVAFRAADLLTGDHASLQAVTHGIDETRGVFQATAEFRCNTVWERENNEQ